MLPTMETILADVKDKLVSSEDNANIISTIIYPNYPTNTPSVLFNWDNCFHNIALRGLQDCTFFKNEIGTFFSNGQVETIIDAVKMNNYNQYKARCQTWLH